VKRIARLVLLALLALLASWSLSVPPAYALASCDNLQGGPCSPEGRTLRCLWSDGGQGLCICTDGLWSC
jgi:hypothetical protein